MVISINFMEVQLFDPGAHLCFDPGEVMERTRVAEVQAMDSRYDTGTREAPMHSCRDVSKAW